MPFVVPSLTEIIERMLADYKSRISGATTLLRRSALNIFAKMYGGANRLLYDYITYYKDQIFATSADTRFLEIIGSEYGITRNFGVLATGTGTTTGTNGVAIPAGSEVQSATGNIYTTDSAATISGGVASVTVTAADVGNDYNEDAGSELTFISPISGVNTIVTIDANAIDGGVSEETDEAYRERVLTRKRQPPHGGADFDYATWCKEVDGVTRAWTFPSYNGIGTIGVAFTRDNDSVIFPTDAEIATVRSYIVEHTDSTTGKQVGMPVTAEPGLLMLDNEPLAVNFEIQVYPYSADIVAAITSNLNDMLFEYGGGEQTIYPSQIWEAITTATGETYSTLVSPTEAITATAKQVHVMGDLSITAVS